MEKIKHKKKHITSLTKEDGNIVQEPKQILEKEGSFKEIYQAKNVCPESANFEHFTDNLNNLKQEEAGTCEGQLTLAECTNSLKQFDNNKTPGSDGCTIEFYRFLLVKSWLIALTMLLKIVHVNLTKARYYIVNTKKRPIQKIPKKLETNLPMNNDYKIASKALALRLEKVLPKIISPNETEYVKGRYIGENIRLITDMMSFTKKKNFPDIAVFLILKTLSILLNGATFKNVLRFLTLVLNYDSGSQSCIITYQVVS